MDLIIDQFLRSYNHRDLSIRLCPSVSVDKVRRWLYVRRNTLDDTAAARVVNLPLSWFLSEL